MTFFRIGLDRNRIFSIIYDSFPLRYTFITPLSHYNYICAPIDPVSILYVLIYMSNSQQVQKNYTLNRGLYYKAFKKK